MVLTIVSASCIIDFRLSCSFASHLLTLFPCVFEIYSTMPICFISKSLLLNKSFVFSCALLMTCCFARISAFISSIKALVLHHWANALYFADSAFLPRIIIKVATAGIAAIPPSTHIPPAIPKATTCYTSPAKPS
ncbi:hypothetical protein HEGA106846_02500 [Helicobacter ganmani]